MLRTPDKQAQPQAGVEPGAGAGGRPGAAVLLLLAFIGGITSLGLEIAASRLLAPYFGTSTYIWGALIGLILLYLTVGYYAGGRLADRYPDPRFLYRLTALASALVLLIPLVSRPILLFSASALAPSDPSRGYNVPGFLGALLAVILIFMPSVVLLGMVSPFVIRLRVARVQDAGRAAGLVYAVSTAGSILGAFMPAFWWIPSYGTRATIYGLGAILLLTTIVGLGLERYSRFIVGLLLLCALPLAGLALPAGPIRPASEGRVIYETDSEYGYIQVLARGGEHDLVLNEGHAIHSVYDPGTLLTGGPWDYFALAPLYGYRRYHGESPKTALIIGLAGGTVARQLTAAYGPIAIDGVEIDPRIIDVGRTYFGMTEPNLTSIAADGRYFLDHTGKNYDLVIVDAYRQPYIPFQLTTREFFESVRLHLTQHGVAAVNVGRAPGDYRLVDAVTGTLAAVFPEVYQQDTGQFDNTLVFAPALPTQPVEVAVNYSLPDSTYPGVLATFVAQARHAPQPVQVEPHLPIYTDDLAPVERLVDSIILRFVTGH